MRRIFILAAAICASCAPLDLEKSILFTHREAIVKLTPVDNETTGGTGFQLRAPTSGKEYVVTNSHVCYLAQDKKQLQSIDSRQNRQILDIVAISDKSDLCILSPVMSIQHPLLIAQYFNRNGRLFTLGHPHLHETSIETGFYTDYLPISAPLNLPLSKCVGPKFSIQNLIVNVGGMFTFNQTLCVMTVNGIETSMIIYPGNSGSPVMNEEGMVVGVIFASDNSMHHGIMVSLQDLREFLADF